MYALIEKMVHLNKKKKDWTKFSIKSSWNEKMLKNQQFNFSLQKLQFFRLYLHSNLNFTNGWLFF